MDLPKPQKEWVLTQEAFDHFLAILDSDRDRAGEKYESIRVRLLKYFQWSGSEVPDIDVDETLNRVMRRIEEGQNVYSLNGYIYGVAKLVLAESVKRRNRKEDMEGGRLFELSSVGIDSTAEQCEQCLEHCLESLTEDEREVIIEYYKYEKAERIAGRKRLAERLGVSLSALRTRTHRQRVELEECLQRCLDRF